MSGSQYPHRQRRLSTVFDSAPTYFLTLCTDGRARILDNPEIMEKVDAFVSESSDRYGVHVDCFVLMPDHAHLIITVAATSGTSVGQWVKAFKAVVARHRFKWQSGFFDHLVRNDESRSEKWEYIHMNPVRAGLVTVPEKWPFARRFNRYDGAGL